MIVYFDTSAVNALYDDPEQRRIVDAIRARGVLRPSEVNVMEVIQTASTDRRHGLLRLLGVLNDGSLPFALPTLILRRIAAAHASNQPGISTEVDRASKDVVRALRSPELVDDYSRDVGLRWSAHVNNEFDSIAVSMREAAQSARPSGNEPWFRSASATIRFLMISPGLQFQKFTTLMYSIETGRPPSVEDVRAVSCHPAWQLFFAASAFAMQRRSMRAERYGKAQSAGGADLGQCVYLAFCDIFVTQDKNQLRALRLLNVLNRSNETKVMSYRLFRDLLLT